MGLAALKEATNPMLERFYEKLPLKPYCGDMKPAYLIRSKRHALRWNYVQANPPGVTAWLTFDIDHNNCWVWEEVGVPAPNLIVKDRETGTSHISYAIVPVCTSEKGRLAPQRYMEAVRKALAKRLRADSEYTGRITKNPFSAYWETHVVHYAEYSLGELAESLDLEYNPPPLLGAQPDETHCPGRNSILFQRLRYWSYSQVEDFRKNSTYEQWETRVRCQAEYLNDYRDTPFQISGPLGINEVYATAKSVAQWTWKVYQGYSNRGVMGLDDTGISMSAKQRLAARRTHQLRSDCTTEEISEAITSLHKQQQRVSKAAVSRITGISRQQISQRYSHLFGRESATTKSVNYGVYQISAPKGCCERRPEKCVAAKPNKQNKQSVIECSARKEIPQSGRVSAKNSQFKHLCGLLASMAAIARQDGAAVKLNYSDRARLTRCLLAQKLSREDAELIALDVSARSVEPKYSHMAVGAWIGYMIQCARALKKRNKQQEDTRKARFDAYLRGEQVNLTDCELNEMLVYQQNGSFDENH